MAIAVRSDRRVGAVECALDLAQEVVHQALQGILVAVAILVLPGCDVELAIERSGSTVSIEAAHPAVGRWDRLRLDQIVTHLLANALKFGLGRPVEVSVAAADGWATLVVSDRGLGVRASRREAIFRPFERAVPVRHYGGLGLGLFIVRTIVTRYGGTVHVEPGVRGGSRFVVRIAQAGAHAHE
jgi:signal transduction histidine kinase